VAYDDKEKYALDMQDEIVTGQKKPPDAEQVHARCFVQSRTEGEKELKSRVLVPLTRAASAIIQLREHPLTVARIARVAPSLRRYASLRA
jgi:hypothetical protein